jgi:hypothetical protein
MDTIIIRLPTLLFSADFSQCKFSKNQAAMGATG